jgi:23S rRNA pseudoU1915 N3-methylase RlmH
VNRDELKSKFSDLKEISFGAITMPHWLAKLVLIEQLYRCKTIQIWKSYHY